MNKVQKVEKIRELMHDHYKQENRSKYSDLTNTFRVELTRYSDSTIASHYKAELINRALESVKADLTPTADANTETFLNRLQELALIINAYIPDTRMNQRYCEIYSFATSKRTPQMINKYRNLEIFNMIGELEEIIKAWERSHEWEEA